MATGPQRMYMGKPHSDLAGQAGRNVNVGHAERVVSALAGGALALYGLSRKSVGGVLLAGVGAALGYRGLRGHSALYRAAGIDTTGPSRTVGNVGVKIEREIIVNAPVARVWGVWRNLENLPRLLSHVQRVEVLGHVRSRWTLRSPVGTRLEWEAEIINDKPNEILAWRSIGNSLVDHAGSVTFHPVDGGTRVNVSLQYDPPGGRFGHAAAALFSEDAGSQIAKDLVEFKRAVEEGRLAA